MDADPWANAWGDTDKPSLPAPSLTSAAPSWTSPKAHDHEQEADLGMPSWSTGAHIKWGEPPDTQGSLWAQPADVAQPWGTSPYENLPISREDYATPEAEPEADHDTEEPEEEQETEDDLQVTEYARSPPANLDPSSPAASLPSPSPVEDDREIAPPSSSPSAVLPPVLPSFPPPESSPDVDGFGTFETSPAALDETNASVEPWSAGIPAIPPVDDAWGASAWKADAPSTPKVEAPAADEDEDEWTAAARQKERQDRVFPPELLASILRQCEEITGELYPPPKTEDGASGEWRKGLDMVEDLDVLRAKFVPDNLTLPPQPKPSTTATARRLADALKLTRHAPVTKSAPLAVFLASKGSTAWEAAVKSRPAAILDDSDITPAGWRILEKPETLAAEAGGEGRKKGGGGLLSFWGRRASVQPAAVEAKRERERSASPVSAGAAASVVSPRSSMDRSASPSVLASQTKSASPGGLVSPSSLGATAPAPAPSSSAPLTPAASTPSALSSYADATSPTFPSTSSPPPAAAPSAVSRFLGRFARQRSTSPRNSLALSGDDLEFLEDVVPNALDDDHENDVDALESMIGSKPLSGPAVEVGKLPPPIAPPPPPSRPRLPSELYRIRSGSGSGSGGAGMSTYDSPVDAGDLFGSMDASPRANPSPPQLQAQAQSKLPPPLPVPISPATMLMPSPPIRQRQGSARDTPLMANTSPGTPAFSFPPPPVPTSRSQTPQPASSGRGLGIPPPPNPKPASLFDDDEFTDFHDPAPAPASGASFDDFADFQAPAPPPDLSGTAFASNASFASSSRVSTGMADFDDFLSPAPPVTRSPEPPRPPAKRPAPPPKQASLSNPQPDALDAPQSRHRKRPSVAPAEHARTVNLMEHAAAHPGQWPHAAPPSPLPQVLSPPPGSKRKDEGEFDFFGDFAVQQETGAPKSTGGVNGNGHGLPLIAPPPGTSRAATPSAPSRSGSAAGASSNGVPFLPPPPGGSRSTTPNTATLPSRSNSSAGTSFNGVPFLPPPPGSRSTTPASAAQPSKAPMPVSAPLAPSKPAASPANGKSGLSAQDLSFFEGL